MKTFLTLAETHTPDGSRFTLHEHDGECYSIEAHFCPAGCDSRDDVGLRLRAGFSGRKPLSNLRN
jgi:hypothetical protein